MILRIDNVYARVSYVFIYDLLYSRILCKVALKFYDTFMRDYFFILRPYNWRQSILDVVGVLCFMCYVCSWCMACINSRKCILCLFGLFDLSCVICKSQSKRESVMALLYIFLSV